MKENESVGTWGYCQLGRCPRCDNDDCFTGVSDVCGELGEETEIMSCERCDFAFTQWIGIATYDDELNVTLYYYEY